MYAAIHVRLQHVPVISAAYMHDCFRCIFLYTYKRVPIDLRVFCAVRYW